MQDYKSYQAYEISGSFVYKWVWEHKIAFVSLGCFLVSKPYNKVQILV